jgi:hypothetical protein
MMNSQERNISAKLKIQRTLQLGRALRFVWESAKGWTIANGVLLVVQGVMPLLSLYLMKLMVDGVMTGLLFSFHWIIAAISFVTVIPGIAVRLKYSGKMYRWQRERTVALVGENGSGKTTLIKLLCRLYDPVHGIISIDGIDLRQFETTALRREISVIL